MTKKDMGLKVFGILGYPLSHTLSPAMQEAAFQSAGIKAYYIVLELSPHYFKTAMRDLRRLPLQGFNITVPHKERILPYLDRLTPEAKAIGAVNTAFKKGSVWVGTNTDVYGFIRSLKQEGKFRPKSKTAIVLGAGGAARAAVYGLAKEGAKTVFVMARRPPKAAKIISDYRRLFPKTQLRAVTFKQKSLKDLLEGSDLVVNATSVGLRTKDKALIEKSWIPKGSLKRRVLFFDLIYHPKETDFLKKAKARGHRTLSGLGMLVFQGVKAFEYWTGKKASVSTMRKTLLQSLGNS